VQRCFDLGRNVLIVDQRAAAHSDGNVITFGIYEHRDALAWLDYAVKRFGPEQKIILTGISMGASTVLLCAQYDLPKNVVCILGDCGFTSAREIIMEVIRAMKLPAKLLYPFVKLGAKLYGHFDPDETSALESVKKSKVPIIFIHGAADDFVPAHMSRSMYEACPAVKHLVMVDGAGHGAAFLVGREQYFRELRQFSKQIGME
jgi:pimeloyl-ACP methyl ester carboxylesterase